MRNQWRGFVTVLVVVVLEWAAPSLSAETAPRVTELHVGFDDGPGTLKVGAWVPVRVVLEGGAGTFRGSLEIAVPDNQGIPSLVAQPVELAAHQSLTITSRVRAGTSNATITAKLLDERGKVVSREFQSKPAAQLALATKQVMYAGSAPGLDDVSKLPKFRSMREQDRMLEFTRITIWPREPLDLDGAAVVVIPSGDRSIKQALRQGGADLLRAWVERGGHLVISLGQESHEVASMWGDLLPARIDGTLELADLGAVESYAGSVPPPLRGPVMVTRLQADLSRNAEVLAATPQTHLVVRGSYGLGRVTLTGLDLQAPPLSDWANRALLWDKLLDLRGQTRDLVGEVVETRGALIQAASTELGVQLHQALETFPSVTLIPFGWVATFIFGYLILIGPIDYLFLRRVARRMEMTWLTFPLIVLATTLGAYWVASALKGTTPRVNKLDLLDLDQASGRLRGTSWWTLYSTANRDFSISLKPQPPNGRSDTQWRLELGRTCTWYSPDESALVGVGRVALMSKPSVYAPAGQLERIEDLRIPIWSTRSFTGRWYGQAPGVRLVDAELRTVAGDRAVGSIRNLLDTPLRNAQLYYGKNVYELGTIRPRGVGRVDYSRAEAVARQLTRLVQKAQRWQHETEHSDEDEAAKMRADLLRAILFHDSMGSRAEAYPSQSLAHLDMSGQMNELRRPMLVAEVDTPAAELQLTGDPAKPAVKQSTVVRIILEMTASETPDL